MSPRASDPFAAGKDFASSISPSCWAVPICAGKISNRLGKLTDLVFRLSEPYPEAVGIYVEHGWGKPTELIPWDRVVKIDDDAVFVQPPESGEQYPPFVDQPGWMLLNEHLMGKTILDMDGRRTEVVNDVHLLESKGRMVIVHVDISFNGFLRKWGLGWLRPSRTASSPGSTCSRCRWKTPWPATPCRSPSPARRSRNCPAKTWPTPWKSFPARSRQAVFSLLDSEKAAETLMEAEPRAQRQIIANLRQERARTILGEMSAPQLADLLSVLPHANKMELLALLPKEQAAPHRGHPLRAARRRPGR